MKMSIIAQRNFDELVYAKMYARNKEVEQTTTNNRREDDRLQFAREVDRSNMKRPEDDPATTQRLRIIDFELKRELTLRELDLVHLKDINN